MKKTFTLLFLVGMLMGFQSNVTAQAPEIAPVLQRVIPDAEMTTRGQKNQNHQLGTRALFDIEFNHDVSTSAGLGHAGVCWTGTEYWVSRWASDTISRFSLAGSFLGKFVISGLTGTRAFTFDGTSVWAANNTTTIREINPTTKTLTGTTITAPQTVRHCTYDSTANSGNGGFWIGNFNTDINLISMTGSTLSTIPAATHGLSGMYGSAFDNISQGGPYLWIFHQGGANNSDLLRLQLPSGNPTIVTHDVMSDVGSSLQSGLAGGLFITDQVVSGEWTIVGLLQGTPTNLLFGYELSGFYQPGIDGELTSGRMTEGYTRIPEDHLFAMNFEGEVTNKGTQTITTATLNVNVDFGGSSVYTGSGTTSSLASNSSATVFASTPFTPASGKGVYDVTLTVSTGAQTDSFPNNDTIYYQFEVTDSTMARDDNNPDGNGYTVSGQGDWAYAVALYDVAVADTISSVDIVLANPILGDTTFAVVVSVSNGFPLTVLKTGTPIIIDDQINDYTLPIPGGVAVGPGQIAVGCYENVANGIGLAQSNNYYTAGTNFFFTSSGQVWTQSGILTARFIRPNFGDPKTNIINREKAQFLGGEVILYPNPSNGMTKLQVQLGQTADLDLTVTDMTGRVVLNETHNNVSNALLPIDLTGQSSGIYFVTLQAEGQQITKKIVIGQ